MAPVSLSSILLCTIPLLSTLLQTTSAAVVPGGFEIIGESGVSALLVSHSTPNTVYIVDKTEANELQVNGHAAWATEYDLRTNKIRPMDIRTNTFCAAGVVLGNGTLLNVGGNLAVTTNNTAIQPTAASQENIYGTVDGRRGIRLLDPCDDGNCEWSDRPARQMNSPRWYPTTELLEDGTSIIFGGSKDGGYINPDDNPTYEYFPNRGADIESALLKRTYPLNLYALAWLLPDARLFINSDYENVVFDHVQNQETILPNIPHAFRVYPASGAAWLSPLTSADNYTHQINFCGGLNRTKDDLTNSVWGPPAFNALRYAADDSCTSIRPLDETPKWTDFDSLPTGRVMVNAIILPDLTTLLINGAEFGTAGYGARGAAPWMNAGSSFADGPLLTPVIFDPKRPVGKQWSSEGLSASTIPRLYHSSAILLQDGSVFVAGSNPNADVVPLANKYGTEYRVEKFYPPYFSSSHRPEPVGLPDKLSYGGEPFVIELSKQDLFGDQKNVENIMVTFIRNGYTTHAINFSQRAIKLDFSYELLTNGGARLHVSQLPSPTIFPPGPALLHVVVDGIPSQGKFVMAGSGELGTQTVLPTTALPANSTKLVSPSVSFRAGPSTSGKAGSNSNSASTTKSNKAIIGAMGIMAFSAMLV